MKGSIRLLKSCPKHFAKLKFISRCFGSYRDFKFIFRCLNAYRDLKFIFLCFSPCRDRKFIFQYFTSHCILLYRENTPSIVFLTQRGKTRNIILLFLSTVKLRFLFKMWVKSLRRMALKKIRYAEQPYWFTRTNNVSGECNKILRKYQNSQWYTKYFKLLLIFV